MWNDESLKIRHRDGLHRAIAKPVPGGRLRWLWRKLLKQHTRKSSGSPGSPLFFRISAIGGLGCAESRTDSFQNVKQRTEERYLPGLMAGFFLVPHNRRQKRVRSTVFALPGG